MNPRRVPFYVHEFSAGKLFLKGAQSRLNGLKSLAKLFNFVVFQSVSIFSILNHPCSFMLCYNLFGVFLSL